MDMKFLVEGLVLRDYKELCQALGITPKGGNGKKAQLRELERHCEFHREGKKYVIDKIYGLKEVKKKTPRGGNNNKYQKELEEIMLCMLNSSDKKAIECSTMEALELCSLVNMNYRLGRNNLKGASETLDIERIYIADFYDKTHGKLKKIFERVLKSMDNRALVSFNKILKIETYTEDGLRVGSEATKEQLAGVLKVQKEVIDEMEFVGKQQIFSAGRWGEFRDLVNERLIETMGIYNHYDSYVIVLNKEGIRKEVDKLATLEAKGKVNSTLVKSLIDSSVRRRNKEMPAFGVIPGKVSTHGNFIEDQNKLIASLIDINSNVHLSQVKKVK